MNKTPWRPLTWLGLGLVWAALLAYFLTRPTLSPMMKQLGFVVRNSVGSVSGSRGAETSKSRTSFSQKGGYWVVDFDSLSSFSADTPDASEDMNPRRDDMNSDPYEHKSTVVKKKAEIPADIQGLDGQKATVEGFMIPMLTEKDRVMSFILAQSQMTCCFGIAPKLNQWIYVEMEKGKNTEWAMDIAIKVSGTLSVGKKYDQENKGWSLYRMVSDKVEIPGKSWF